MDLQPLVYQMLADLTFILRGFTFLTNCNIPILGTTFDAGVEKVN